MAEKIIELNDRQLGYQYELEPKLGYDMISIYNFKHIDTGINVISIKVNIFELHPYQD